MKRFLILILCLLLIACTASSPDPVSENKPSDSIPVSSEPANDPVEPAESEEPAPSVKTAKDNFPFSTTDLDGNPINQDCFADYDLIMLNFWAYWCGPCISELPELEQLHQAYPNLLLLGVSIDNDDLNLVQNAVENGGITYPVVFPNGGLLYLENQCMYIPTTYFLSPDGEILGEPLVGSNDLAGWTSVVESYLH